VQEKPVQTPPTVAAKVNAGAVRFPNLEAAVASRWGTTAADIQKRWPKSHKMPAFHVLDTLAQDPEKALAEDANLLLAVHNILGSALPTEAYSPKLRAKLAAHSKA
jgi:hypothetical protein